MGRQLIADTHRSVLYREDRDAGPVVLKLLKAEHASADRLLRFNNELHISNQLEIDGVRRVIGKVQHEGKHGLELAYVSGAPPSLKPVASPVALLAVLERVRSLCRILAQVHAAGVIHRDIKPANLVIDEQTGAVTLIDFGCATRVQHRDLDMVSAGHLEGTLAYMSPEQTGRMNRSVDSRSDLYSVGVTLYEMLTGKVPFESVDPMTVVHAHIAHEAPRLEQRQGVPAAVAEIVAKLLQKDADARYQTASGVSADLTRCIDALRQGAVLEPFELGTQDRRSTFRISERLYGRTDEVEQLLQAFERVNRGTAELVLIGGYSGIGKTKLVREIDPLVVQRRGYFVTGKFERLHRSTPYFGLIQALTQLAEQILTEEQEQLDAWRMQITHAVGDLGGVLLRLVPAFEAVIGAQPDVPELGPDETRKRFTLVMTAFLRACASQGRPVVLFLDDLQWADFAALDLLEVLLGNPHGQSLLVIGAFRDNEVDATHPLSLVVQRLGDGALPVHQVHLGPLGLSDVADLLRDSLGANDVADLAQITLTKTGGNPFFVGQFLHRVRQRGLIRHEGADWMWDTAGIQALDITDNLADLLSAALHELPPETQAMVQLAASVGHRVEVHTLALVSDRSPGAALQEIWPAVEAGYLHPTHRLFGAAVHDGLLDDALETSLVFAHDRVQQAAYLLADASTRARHHLRIGTAMLAAGEDDGQLFDVVNHLNLAGEAFDEPVTLAGLNRRAGQRACLAAAHQQGLAYYQTALALLPADTWGADQLAIHTGASLAAYQLGSLDDALAHAQQVLANTVDPLERVPVHRVRMMVAVARDDLGEAVGYGLEALDELGEPFPANPIGPHIGLALVKLRWHLWGKDVAGLASQQSMASPEKREAMWVLEKVLPAAFRTSSNYFPLFVMRLVLLTLRHGISPVSSFAYAGYAIMLAGLLGDVRGAYAFGELSVRLSEQDAHEHAALRSKALFVFNNMVRHWTEPLQRSVPGLVDAYQSAVEAGSVFDIVWASFYRIAWMLVTGSDLSEVAQELADYRSVHAQDAGAAQESALLEQVVYNLQHPDVEAPWRLAGPYCDDAQMLARLEVTDDRTEAVLYRWFRGWLCNLFGRHDEALSHLQLAEAELEAVVALPFVPLVHLEAGIARVGVVRGGGHTDLRPVRKAVKKLAKWAVDSPENYRHKHAWLAAELAWQTGNMTQARDGFQVALNAARQSGWRHEEARILESAFHFYEATDDAVLAEALRERALVAYRAWGSVAKVEQLVPTLGAITANPVPQTSFNLGQSGGTDSRGVSGLDLSSLMKAAAAVTSTLDLDELLTRLLDLLVENTGATHGAIVLPVEAGWQVAALVDVSQGQSQRTAIALESCDDVCGAAVRLTARRAEALVVGQVGQDQRFREYGTDQSVQSMLCVPIVQQGDIAAVVYFEHRSATDAFTPQRVAFVELLAAQVAIGVENARLHHDLADAFAVQVALNDAHRRFVPQRFLDGLGRDSIAEVALGDAIEKDMTILFSDIRAFTTLIEGMAADESIDFINQYLALMEPAIHRNAGFVDSYIGDAIMALFEGETDGAVRAAIQMQQGLATLNATRAEQGKAPVVMGLGLAHGPVMMGTIGGENRLKCGVIGDSVNLAARMETLTKQYGVHLFVAESVRAGLTDPSQFLMRRADRVLVKGKTEPVTVWEVFDADPVALRDAKAASLGAHQDAMERYYQRDFAGAANGFASVLQEIPGDALVQIQLARARRLAESGVPDAWDGTERLSKK